LVVDVALCFLVVDVTTLVVDDVAFDFLVVDVDVVEVVEDVEVDVTGVFATHMPVALHVPV